MGTNRFPLLLQIWGSNEVESPLTCREFFTYVGPGLGVVFEEEDPEEVMDVGAEDEFIAEEDGGGSRLTFRYVLVSPRLSLKRHLY